MVAQSKDFGETPDGETVIRVSLFGGGLSADILTWGATLQDLRLNSQDKPLVLGFPVLDDYLERGSYFGAIAGRYANRIAGGQFKLDGAVHQLDCNEGRNILHGGRLGTAHRNWQVASLGTSHVILTLEDEAGHMGFPGTCRHTCTYTLKAENTLQIALTTICDAPTIANLAPHPYFTLNDAGDSREHVLRILADNYLPIDESGIPTGQIKPVDKTPFDFRQLRYVHAEANGTYDHNFCLSEDRKALRHAATLRHDPAEISMRLFTTEPGLQVYTASKMNAGKGLHEKPYGPFAGIALEPQNWPDAPNRPDFPSPVLRPGEELRQVSEFRFSHGWGA